MNAARLNENDEGHYLRASLYHRMTSALLERGRVGFSLSFQTNLFDTPEGEKLLSLYLQKETYVQAMLDFHAILQRCMKSLNRSNVERS